MKNIKKYKDYFIGPLIVLLIVLFTFLLKGIYPFGNKTIAIGDLGQSYMTFYHFLFDVLRGDKSVFFDYALGMGSNTYGGFVIDGFINPINWIVAIGSRNSIPYKLSFVLIIKLMVISLTSYILFKKINRKNNFYNILFSVFYALSGYTLCYYSNLMWLDVVALFPLFVLATKYMFDTNKTYWFGIVLALILICNYNLAYMVLLFIIIIIPIYIHFVLDKKDRKKAVFNLIIGVLISIGLSAFAFIPALMQTLSSYRMSGEITNTVTNINFYHKFCMILFQSLPITIFLLSLKNRDKKNKIYKSANIALLLCLVIPIFIERVNLWWHTGSYQQFPFRFGFIPILILYMTSLYYINNMKEEDKKDINIKKIIFISFLIVVLGLFTARSAITINSNNPVFNYSNFSIYSLIIISFVFAVLIDLNSLIIVNKKTRYVLLFISSLVMTMSYSYAYLGNAGGVNADVEHGDAPVFYAEKLASELQSDLYRVKDLSNYQYENNPVVSNLPSMLSFLHLISKEQVENTKQLGYSINITKLLDGGGTLFTDQLYGIKYVISNKEKPDRIYDYIGRFEDKYIYKYKNNISYGVLTENPEEFISKDYQLFDANNYLYKTLFNKEDNIIDVLKYNVSKDNLELEYNIKIDGEQELYLYIPRDINGNYIYCKEILVDGKALSIPVMNDQESTSYPNSAVNGILDLGYFKNQTVNIKFKILSRKDIKEDFSIEFGKLDLKKYDEILNTKHDISTKIDKNRIIVSGKSDKDTKIVLPITFDDGFKSDAKIKRAYNNFLEVPISKGKNNITITFIPKFFIGSLITTVVTIVLMILFHFIKKVFDIRNIKFITFIFWLFGLFVYILVMIKFYIISIWQTLI